MEQKLIKLRFREDTPENWAAVNPILDSSEPGAEIGTGLYKIGDGKTPWNELQYANTNTNDEPTTFVAECPDDSKFYVRTREPNHTYGKWVEFPETDVDALIDRFIDLEKTNSYNT